jgi:hypothetical protein
MAGREQSLTVRSQAVLSDQCPTSCTNRSWRAGTWRAEIWRAEIWRAEIWRAERRVCPSQPCPSLATPAGRPGVPTPAGRPGVPTPAGRPGVPTPAGRPGVPRWPRGSLAGSPRRVAWLVPPSRIDTTDWYPAGRNSPLGNPFCVSGLGNPFCRLQLREGPAPSRLSSAPSHGSRALLGWLLDGPTHPRTLAIGWAI